MTVSKDLRSSFDAAFRYAKLGRDPEFRQYLKDIGWHSGQDIVVATETEPVIEVLDRIFSDGASSPCLIAIELRAERFGFGLLFAEVRRASWRTILRRRAGRIDIAPEASIGMLYSSLQRCGEYIPNEWVKPVLFERPSA